MSLLGIIVLIVVMIILFGSGYGYRQSGYWDRGGPYVYGGILVPILVILLVLYLVGLF